MTGARTMAARIADEIADWAGDQDPWTPVPPDDEVSGWLDFVASPDTVQAAKRALVELGVLVKDGGRFCVAARDGSAAATGGRP